MIMTLRDALAGKEYMIDESVECLKNAIDGCVWTADFLKSIEER